LSDIFARLFAEYLANCSTRTGLWFGNQNGQQ